MKKISRIYIFFIFALSFTACNSEKNTIEGNIGYPSDYVPEVVVYLEDVDSGDFFKQTIDFSLDGESKYIFQDIPNGKYIIYAIPTEQDTEMLIGGYTHAVPCGLTAECINHDYLHLEVKNGTHLQNINIYDWFAGGVAIDRMLKEHS